MTHQARALWTAVLSLLCLCAPAFDSGTNFPPTQGSSGEGAYFPGVFQYAYHPSAIARVMKRSGFSAMRLGINVETARDPATLARFKEYIDLSGGRALITMFDEGTTAGLNQPRYGRITNIDAAADAWRHVHEVFASYGDRVLYELFNEPWGYATNVDAYVADMLLVVTKAKLPASRCLLAGLGYSWDVRSVANRGWPGLLAYHIYPWYLVEAKRTSAAAFRDQMLGDLRGLGARVFLTEFGSSLYGSEVDVRELDVKRDVVRHRDNETVTSDWHLEHDPTASVADICAKDPGNLWCQRKKRAKKLEQHIDMVQREKRGRQGYDANVTEAYFKGLRDAMLALRSEGEGIQGAYHWHGWHNGDTFDYWDAKGARGARLIQMMLSDVRQATEGNHTDPWQREDLAHDDQEVHMLKLRTLDAGAAAPQCSEECDKSKCVGGDQTKMSGRMLNGCTSAGCLGRGQCYHRCSKIEGGKRWCGFGPEYEGPDSVDCTPCAGPPVCFGLPCWSGDDASGGSKSFLQRPPMI